MIYGIHDKIYTAICDRTPFQVSEPGARDYLSRTEWKLLANDCWTLAGEIQFLVRPQCLARVGPKA
jgi:hypothetical protein